MFEYNVSSVVYDVVAAATNGALRRHNRKTILRFSGFYPGESIRCNHAHVPSKARRAPENLFELESRETDRDKRNHLVWEIDRQLQEDGARPIIHRRRRSRRFSSICSVRRVFDGARGPRGLGGLRFGALVGAELLGPLAREFKEAPALHFGIEHFQGSPAGVHLVVVGEIGEAFEDAEQILVPRDSQNPHIAGNALRAERPEPRELVAALRGRHNGEHTHCAHQVKRPALAGLPRILAELDAHPLTVLGRGIQHQFFRRRPGGPATHQIQEPIAAVHPIEKAGPRG
jgi:hypothetical protein